MFEKEMFIVGILLGLIVGYITGSFIEVCFNYNDQEMNDVLFYTLIDEETKAFIESQFDQGKIVKFNSEYKPRGVENMTLDKDKQLLWKELRR